MGCSGLVVEGVNTYIDRVEEIVKQWKGEAVLKFRRLLSYLYCNMV